MFGVAEEEWLGLFPPHMDDVFIYEDFVKVAKEKVKFLKESQNCDIIIALTHMRLPNDRVLADSVPGVDLCLGGHDHMYVAEMRESTGVSLVKSGTDFEEFSDIKIEFGVTQDEAD